MKAAGGSGGAGAMSARRSAVERLKARRGFHEENVWTRELVGTRSRQATPRLPERHEQEPKAWMTRAILYEEDAAPSAENTSSAAEDLERINLGDVDRIKLVERCAEIADLRKTIADLEAGVDLHPEHSRAAQQSAVLRRESMREAERAKWLAELNGSKQRKSVAVVALQGLASRSQESERQYRSMCEQLREQLGRNRQDLAGERAALERVVAEHQCSLATDVVAEAEDAQIALMRRRVARLREQLAAATAATPLAPVRLAGTLAVGAAATAELRKEAPLRRWLSLSESALAKRFVETMVASRAELEADGRAAVVATEQLRLTGAAYADVAGVNWAEAELLRVRSAQLGLEVEDAIAEFLSTAIWGASVRSGQATSPAGVLSALSRSPTPLAARPKSVLA